MPLKPNSVLTSSKNIQVAGNKIEIHKKEIRQASSCRKVIILQGKLTGPPC